MSEQKPTGGTPQEPGKSWIEKLAQQSTGLPQDVTPAPPKRSAESNSPWRFAGLGIQFAITVGLFAWIGYKIDEWRGAKDNWVLLTLVLISVLGNMYLLIKEAIKANK